VHNPFADEACFEGEDEGISDTDVNEGEPENDLLTVA
jgi:hypothetical protein